MKVNKFYSQDLEATRELEKAFSFPSPMMHVNMWGPGRRLLSGHRAWWQLRDQRQGCKGQESVSASWPRRAHPLFLPRAPALHLYHLRPVQPSHHHHPAPPSGNSPSIGCGLGDPEGWVGTTGGAQVLRAATGHWNSHRAAPLPSPEQRLLETVGGRGWRAG